MLQVGQAAQRHEPKFCQSLLDHYIEAQRLIAQPKYARDVQAAVRKFLFNQHIAYPHDVTVEAVERYLLALKNDGRSQNTLINHKSYLAGFFGFLQRRGMIGQNPCVHVRLQRPEERLPHYLDDSELKLTLALARKLHIWPEVCLAIATGLRLSELIRLKWVDIDFGRRFVAVRKSKSRRPRVVPLSRAALTALRLQERKAGTFDYVFPGRRTWRGGWQYLNKPRAINWWIRAPQTIKDAVPTFQRIKPGSTGRFWHTCRHTFATRLAEADVSLAKIGKWMGHHDPRVTSIYAHLQDGFDPKIEAADGRMEAAEKFAQRKPAMADMLGRPAEPLPAPELTKDELAKLTKAEAREVSLALGGKNFKEIALAEGERVFAIRRNIYEAEAKAPTLVDKLKLAGFHGAGYWLRPPRQRTPKTKKCPFCHRMFRAAGSRRAYCCSQCAWQAKRARTHVPRRPGVEKCRACGHEFTPIRSGHVCCSPQCNLRVQHARTKARKRAQGA